jgi:hypothetical protein
VAVSAPPCVEAPIVPGEVTTFGAPTDADIAGPAVAGVAFFGVPH